MKCRKKSNLQMGKIRVFQASFHTSTCNGIVLWGFGNLVAISNLPNREGDDREIGEKRRHFTFEYRATTGVLFCFHPRLIAVLSPPWLHQWALGRTGPPASARRAHIYLQPACDRARGRPRRDGWAGKHPGHPDHDPADDDIAGLPPAPPRPTVRASTGCALTLPAPGRGAHARMRAGHGPR